MSESINIFVRVRPLLQNEDEEAWKIQNQQLQSIPRDPTTTRRYADAFYNYTFNFDRLFSIHDKNHEIFESCQSMINQVTQGYNASIFLYGQTTSGKTFTMLGDEGDPGLLPLMLLELFKRSTQPKYISYLEIYNEQINDLLNPGSVNLKMQDSQGGAVVPQLRIELVNSFDDALSLLCFGEEQRSYRSKQVHEHSSRSHTIFQVTLQDQYISTLSLIDLAGSERLQDDDTSDETGYINKSLFVLSNVINKLAEGKKSHIPYRDSKLTRYLQNSLGGNSFTTIICTISPASMNFTQSLSTLRFAQRAKKVQIKVHKNSLPDQNLELEIQTLRAENQRLQAQSTDFNHIMYLSYLQLMSPEIIDFTQIQQRYTQQLSQLNLTFQQQALQATNLQMKPNLDYKAVAIENKIALTKMLETETVFNNVPVNSILNPQSAIECDIELFDQQLRQAYEETNAALNSTFERVQLNIGLICGILTSTNGLVRDVHGHLKMVEEEYKWMEMALGMLKDQLQRKQQILQQAMQNVQMNQIPQPMILKTEQVMHTRQSTSTPKFTDRDRSIVMVWGSGKDGRLGTGTQLNQSKPVKIGISNIVQITAGLHNSAAINNENQLFMWGKSVGLMPVAIMQNVVQVACGWQHTLALLTNGKVASWGTGDEGQLGTNLSQSPQPRIIDSLQDIIQISAGHTHSGAVASNGSIYLWGSNLDQRLSLSVDPVQQPTMINYQGKKISLGYNHTAVINLQNNLICFGSSTCGQLGRGEDQLLDCADVACGEEFTIIVTRQGQIYSCGKKSNGTLGHVMSAIPTYVTQPMLIDKLSKVTFVSVGKRHCLAITQSRQLYGWGFNFYDQLGLGDKNKFIEVPIQLPLDDVLSVSCGEYHSLALISQ